MPKLRLKDLRMNQVPFYYQTYDGTVDEVDEDGNLTGESIPKYSYPSMTRPYQPYRNCRLMNTQNSS